MEKERLVQRLIEILEVEFHMQDALEIPSKIPGGIEMRFFSDDEEYQLKISKKKGTRK